MEQLTQVLVDTLREIKEQTGRPVTSAIASAIEVPRFYPSTDSDGASKWCAEIEQLGTTFGWSDFEQVTRASSGLTGEAREWFSSWHPVIKTWERFKYEICTLYPPKKNLSEKFRKAGLYTSDDAMSYCEYARKKISLINALNFNLSDLQLLEIVIGDIRDVQVRTAVFNANVDSVSSLLALLTNYKVNKREVVPSGSKLKRAYPFREGSTTDLNLKLCYRCNRPGHISRHCQELLQATTTNSAKSSINKVICNFCGKLGHNSDKCFLKNKRDTKSDQS